ncbi:hypothetical protein QE177_14040 [Arsenophonus sp. aPb]|uniref:hypothetical protein n=1 Tax=Arsenophonus sp. aPb TaxID=3041619 RepID=UPI002469595A|nr:hypothetical protein [Arsenophonus sp. aPb]WGL98271.1 hypothetical protein QE177_14040 [Arsenophonus sp. aPb]
MTEINHYHIHKLEDMNFHRELDKFDFTALSQPEITVFVAPAGSPIYDDQGIEEIGESMTGHIFLGVKNVNYKMGKFEAISIGLSPAEDWGTANNNLSFNDHLRYKNASTLSITSDTPNFYNDVENLTTIINNYKTGKTAIPNDSLASSLFIQEYVLKQANITGINIPFTPYSAKNQLSSIADSYRTPLIIDLNGDGVQTVADSLGVSFDFAGKGKKAQTGWVHPDDGLLVWDKDNDGVISSGEELFGEDSLLANGTKAKDGFSALAPFDNNLDGLIDKKDNLWSEIKIWQDKNTDGISQANELTAMESIGIKSIELNAKQTNFYDKNGNFHQLMAKVNWDNNKQTDITDVLFHQNNLNNYTSGLQQTLAQIIDAMVSFSPLTHHEFALITSKHYEYNTSVFLVPNNLS